MGAVTFSDTMNGKDVHEAFCEAVRQAQYDHGHSGYTGTIAEKSGYMVIERPKNIKASTVREAIVLANFSTKYCEQYGSTVKGADTAYDRLVGWYGARLTRSILDTYNDKWGDCIAIECSPSEVKEYKERNRVGVFVTYKTVNGKTEQIITKKTVRNFHLFMFFGWASC